MPHLYRGINLFTPLLVLLVCLVFLKPHSNVLADGTYSSLGTADAADGSNDAINFSQGRVWTIDQYGKYIWMTQVRGGDSHWAFSNDLGANWTQGSESYGFLTRASVAYDSINDKLHVIWAATDNNDGIIYRRYGITRDGSNNITAIAREDSGNINLQLDTSSSRSLEAPVAIWVNDGSADGSLVAIWSKYGTSLTEIRASMRKLTISAADGIAGNWVALDGTADTFSTDPPAVAADKIYGSTTAGQIYASAKIRGGSGARKDDMYIFGTENVGANSRLLAYRGIWDSVDKDWGGGWQAPVVVGQINTSGGGYNLKYQLLTKPVIDTSNDRLYVGWSRWKSGGDGDTDSFNYLDSTDTPGTVVDVYAALGTHSYAPTLDIAFDNTLGKLYVSYLESTTNGDNGSIDYKTYDGSTLSSETRFYTSPGGSAGADGSADIPILYESRSSNDRLLFAFRINGALPPTSGDPHKIDWGYITLPSATPTPSPTSNSSTSANSPTSSTNNPPSCTDLVPSSAPNLFQVDVAGTFAVLYFTSVNSSVNSYNIGYGLNEQANQYGDLYGYSGPKWVLDRTVSSLSPNTTYYFKVQAQNGCVAGGWSNVVKIKTKGRNADFIGTLAKLNPFKKNPTPVSSAAVLGSSSCDYIVETGDSLWAIAQSKLGNGARFREIIESNIAQFPNLNNSTNIKVGWQLKVGC